MIETTTQLAAGSLDPTADIENQKPGFGKRLVALAVAGALLVSACGSGDNDASIPIKTYPMENTDQEPVSSPPTANTADTDSANSSELRDLLTVGDESAFDCIEGNDGSAGLVPLSADLTVVKQRLVSTLPLFSNLSDEKQSAASPQDYRFFGDSMANPIENRDTKQDALTEFQNTVCESPVVAKALAHYFAHEIGDNGSIDGLKVVNLNPWLEAAAPESADMINDEALKLVPGYVDGNATDEQILEGNLAHKELAEKLATLMERFQNMGLVEDIQTVFNYRLGAGGLQAGSLPEVVENDVQYRGNFIEFKLTAKDGRCYTLMLINLDDQRIAETADECGVTPPEKPGATTTTIPGEVATTTTTTIPGEVATTTTTSTVSDTRPELEVVTNSSVVSGPGAGGEPDTDDNPNNNVTTTHVSTPPTTIRVITPEGEVDLTPTTTTAQTTTGATLPPVVIE
jgi:hypothetical protein